ncbi:MAG: hypothetical protein ING66_01175 [Rhodocyclaceae bacterium]|jgi:hypothetical protein|nr:hypothetical protein [Rhodocyclaceae bacterium]MCA3034177.1 hypothetical protein [Rhodocyclaceae bacterium]MCA3058895.1 hypothetical protein [Rhodocyclaceae bacterium]MCA3081039.1 hypothetical protein [Rhodocyclaceae bacterium]
MKATAQIKSALILALALDTVSAVASDLPAKRSQALDDLVPRVSALHIELKQGALMFFGSKHSFDPADQQNADIETLWLRFSPTVAVVEGGNWPVITDRTAAIRQYGEMGFTTLLAAKSKVRKLDADPPIEQELQYVLRTNSPEAVKLYYTLRMVPQWGMETTSVPIEEKLSKFLTSPTFRPHSALTRVLTTPKEFEAALNQIAPQLNAWKTLTGSFVSVAGPESRLGGVARSSNQFRDDHMFRQVAELVSKGERVFLIAGNDHLIAQRAKISSAILKRDPT